ncbi:synaptotagmin-like protein 2 isoform X2 [Alosa pseudoharengus]|uniref:synaptotagmin-like protein 2 isoform X2 n=1 Tax=Alosa pseudoharengus TaxID=34774 RepID=UPI003F8C5316
MIDLSFLTDEEQEMIMVVLKRDAELKKSEDQRVKDLQKTMRDRNKLKYMTGEWFYETKSQRHRDRIHGSDIIRASIRQRKPVTVFELSKVWAEKPSFVNSGNRDVFLPPELAGIIDDEPQTQSKNQREYACSSESQSGVSKPAVQPQVKLRLNPFNNRPTSLASPGGESQQVSNGTTQTVKTPARESHPSYESPIVTHTNQTSDSFEKSQATLNTHKPVPRKRVLHVSGDYSVDRNRPARKSVATPAPRGILKHCNSISSSSSSSSSNDSLPPHSNYNQKTEPLSPVDLPDSPSSGSSSGCWLDRKQVRFSGIVRGRNPVLQNGRELGEHDLLDHDRVVLSDEEEGQTDKSDTSISSSNGDDASSEGLSSPRDECDGPFFSKIRQKTEPELCIGSKSSPQDSCLWGSKRVNRKEVMTGELQNSTEGSLQNGSKDGEARRPTGWHDGLAQPPASEVSSLHATVPETDNSEDTSPVRTMLKRASRPMSLSKSLEDITTMPARKCPVKMGEERMRTDQRSDLMLSANDVSVAPSSPTSAPDPEQMKRMSASVPAFLQQESYDREHICTSENSFYSPHRPQKRNSHTNHSFSSGMASMSSSVSGSVMSIYSGDFGSVDVKGTIQFAMNYVEKLGEFHIFVVQCRDLAVAEPKRNRSDPYVKCYLLPDKAKLGKRKTSVKKKTLNPTFNEILRYKISFDTLRITTLNLSVWHNDNFGRNSFLGEVDVDLREWNISDTQMNDYLLRPRVVSRPNTTEQRGDMRVALRFLPQVTQSKRASKAGEVQIWVRECKNLPVVRGVIIDPFVKCTVLPDTSRKGRQKTRVAKKTADPVFNHTMVYDGFKPEDLREACVELTVWDHDRLSNHFLGGLRLGLGTGKSYGSEVTWMDSTSDEAKLWNRMMISQGEWVEDVLPLRMLMMAK